MRHRSLSLLPWHAGLHAGLRRARPWLYTIWRPTCIAGAGSPATYTGCVATARTKEWPALSAPKLARRASRTICRSI